MSINTINLIFLGYQPTEKHISSRFSWPSQFSMDLATKILDNQEFVEKLLRTSQRLLLENRLLAEDLLNQAGIRFYNEGYESCANIVLLRTQ